MRFSTLPSATRFPTRARSFSRSSRPEEVLQIRIDDPLASALHFAPDLGQGVGGLATLPITETARIEDFLEDRLQPIDQRLPTYPVIDRGYAKEASSCRRFPFLESAIVAPLAVDGRPSQALDAAGRDSPPAGFRTPRSSPCLRRWLLGWRERALNASFKFLRAYTLSTKEWTFSLRPSRTR